MSIPITQESDSAQERLKLLAQIRKEFGEQSMFILGQNEKLMNIEFRGSGSLQLDVALGGGFPKGRIIEFAGKEKAGKTTLANLAIAQAQIDEPHKENAIIDLEHTYNPTWATELGVDVDRLFITQPDTYAEAVMEMLEYMIGTGRYAYIVLDSVAGLIPKDEFDKNWSKDSQVGGNSKNNSRAMRSIVFSGLLTKSETTLIFINQLRDKIGGFSAYGTPTDTPGGRALKHAYTQQLDLSVGDYIAKGTGESRIVLGQQAKIKVSKNKVAAPFKQANLDLYYEGGIDRYKELVKVAKIIGVLNGTSWLSFTDPNTGEIFTQYGKDGKFNGEDKTREAIIEDAQNGSGELYQHMLSVVQRVIRG